MSSPATFIFTSTRYVYLAIWKRNARTTSNLTSIVHQSKDRHGTAAISSSILWRFLHNTRKCDSHRPALIASWPPFMTPSNSENPLMKPEENFIHLSLSVTIKNCSQHVVITPRTYDERDLSEAWFTDKGRLVYVSYAPEKSRLKKATWIWVVHSTRHI